MHSYNIYTVYYNISHLCRPVRSTFVVRETDSALRALSTLRGLRGAPEVPPLCPETQSLGQKMLNAMEGINGLIVWKFGKALPHLL